jgi:2-C-methyl-D-erythritol 4-phosphate cytidylyltransferase
LKKYVIIVAGGQGKRMESEIPKQFLHAAGKPVLMHTISKFYDYSQDISIRVVLPEPYIDFWKSLCNRFEFTLKHTVLEGGKSRFYSVRNGLKDIDQNSLVAIHDGVRPLVSMNTIHLGFKTAEKKGNAIPVVKMNESIRQLKNGESVPANRKKFRIIQTPQCFHSDIVKSAYEQEFREEFTDDATVVEALGQKINPFDGNYENIKITRPVDLKIAETFLK